VQHFIITGMKITHSMMMMKIIKVSRGFSSITFTARQSTHACPSDKPEQYSAEPEL
jgi:hypothetical protein